MKAAAKTARRAVRIMRVPLREPWIFVTVIVLCAVVVGLLVAISRSPGPYAHVPCITRASWVDEITCRRFAVVAIFDTGNGTLWTANTTVTTYPNHTAAAMLAATDYLRGTEHTCDHRRGTHLLYLHGQAPPVHVHDSPEQVALVVVGCLLMCVWMELYCAHKSDAAESHDVPRRTDVSALETGFPMARGPFVIEDYSDDGDGGDVILLQPMGGSAATGSIE